MAQPHARASTGATSRGRASTKRTRARGAQPNNSNAATHHVYGKWFSDDELARVIQAVSDPAAGLTAAADATYVLLDRVIAAITAYAASDPDTLVKLVSAHNETTGRIAHLLRSKRLITAEAADSLSGHIAGVLDELAEHLQVKL